jgi:hypothetical protein
MMRQRTKNQSKAFWERRAWTETNGRKTFVALAAFAPLHRLLCLYRSARNAIIHLNEAIMISPGRVARLSRQHSIDWPGSGRLAEAIAALAKRWSSRRAVDATAVHGRGDWATRS